MPISFTIDLEDPTEAYAPDGRYIAMTRRILDLCAAVKCRATFFTVGRVAVAAPQLIKDIAARGHEVAYHSHAHVPLTDEEDEEKFRSECKEDKNRLEQLAGKPVIGYRAPGFSLTPDSIWAIDVLGELGFRYSSSVMSTWISRYGFPDAPRVPFRWPNGMIEFPLPLAGRVPYLGGIYLYALPFAFTWRWVAGCTDEKEVLWTYTHPYDFDRKEGFGAMANTPVWVSAILWASRRVAEKKIRKVLALGVAPPLGERLPTPPPAVWQLL